jgi:hypothetical protein
VHKPLEKRRFRSDHGIAAQSPGTALLFLANFALLFDLTLSTHPPALVEQRRGWVRANPTAALHPERVDPECRLAALGTSAPVRFRLDDQGLLGRTVHGVRLLADAMDTGWRQWVVGFSRLKQQRLLEHFGVGHLREFRLALGITIGGALNMLLWSLVLSRPARAGSG